MPTKQSPTQLISATVKSKPLVLVLSKASTRAFVISLEHSHSPLIMKLINEVLEVFLIDGALLVTMEVVLGIFVGSVLE